MGGENSSLGTISGFCYVVKVSQCECWKIKGDSKNNVAIIEKENVLHNLGSSAGIEGNVDVVSEFTLLERIG